MANLFKIYRQSNAWAVVEASNQITFHQTLPRAMDYAAAQNRKTADFGASKRSHQDSNNG
jgi:hypothetical protein